MDTFGLVSQFALDYAKDMNNAVLNDDWDEQTALYREAKRTQRELGNVINAIETLRRYGIKAY